MSVSRRDFLKGAACAGAAVAASSAIAVADEAEAKAPVFDNYDFFAQSRVVWQDIPEDQIAETYDYDYVVIGGGNSGVISAMAASCNGVGKVALLQNAYACISGGWGASGLVPEESDPAGLGRYKWQWNDQNLYRTDQHILQNVLDYSGAAIDFVYQVATVESGIEPNTNKIAPREFGGYNVAIHTLEYGPKPRGYVDALNAISEAAAPAHGVDFYFGMPGVKLIQDESGRVIAAIGKSLDDDKYYRFNASKGVLLACGSFQCNEAMLERYCSDAVGFESKVDGYFGDGHIMGLLAGGVMRNGAYSKMIHDSDNPMSSVPFFAVNDDGVRFMDEEVDMKWVNNYLKDQPNTGWWSSVFDSDYMEQVASWGYKTVDEAGMQKYMPGTPENLELGVFAQHCHTYKADTLEDLAAQLGIPADALIASVERYNELVELGVDLDFGKNPKFLAPIKNPPFWGVHRHQRLSAILSGLNVDKYMCVLDKNKQPIPGLYASGNCAGVPSGNCDWYQIQGGGSNGNAITGGYVAALHVSGVIGE